MKKIGLTNVAPNSLIIKDFLDIGGGQRRDNSLPPTKEKNRLQRAIRNKSC